jgi:hypothetical protein
MMEKSILNLRVTFCKPCASCRLKKNYHKGTREHKDNFDAKPYRVSMRNLTGFQCETLPGFSAKPYRVSMRNLTGFRCETLPDFSAKPYNHS